jgi:hypothetical protein
LRPPFYADLVNGKRLSCLTAQSLLIGFPEFGKNCENTGT